MPTPVYDGETFETSQSEDDKKLFVQFFIEAVKNEFESTKQGRAIFTDVPMIRVMTPGSRDVTVSKVTERYKERFPRHWERFQKQLDQSVDGTPLEQVPFLTPSQIAELKYMNCITLEQLAGMSDSLASKIMGSQQIRQRAKDFLAAAQSAAPMMQLRAELEKRDDTIAEMKIKMEALEQAVTKLTAKTLVTAKG
jgi:hypothetical protein